jgi:hypothetical protein
MKRTSTRRRRKRKTRIIIMKGVKRSEILIERMTIGNKRTDKPCMKTLRV